MREIPIHLEVNRMGRDVVMRITGGDAHIGAAATAYSGPEGTTVGEVICLPGHCEGDLVLELAKLASAELQVTVTVLAGIHVHQPTLEEIQDIVLRSIRAVRNAVSRETGRGAE